MMIWTSLPGEERSEGALPGSACGGRRPLPGRTNPLPKTLPAKVNGSSGSKVRCHSSWGTVRQTLATHQVATIVLPTDGGKILEIRKGTTPEAEHVELYRVLEVPTEIIRPQRTWIEPQGLRYSD